MKVYYAPKFGNMYMAAIDKDGLWGLWGCNVPEGVEPRDALLKRLKGKDIKTVARKPFYENGEFQVFGGEAEWDWRENVAIPENMMMSFLEHGCSV